MTASTAPAEAAAGAPSAPLSPRTLLFFLSSKQAYREPLFSTNEVFCSPDAFPAWDNGRITAYQTPTGAYDVRDVAHKLTDGGKPELVVVKADATLRNCPRNLARLKCPRVLIVGDTHHLQQPLQKLIRYAREEQFDAVIFDHTRHHALYFIEAGVRNVQWIPAVDYAFHSREPSAAPSRPLTFFGQVGRHHPFRRQVMDQIRAAGLPLETLQGTIQDAADTYADSQITLNVSLNGDLNLRVFESLAAGGFLLTDALPDASGLPGLFETGKHLVTWKTPAELIERIRYYLDHPDEAQKIRRAGHEEVVKNHSPAVKIREFFDLVFDRKVNPRYSLEALKERATTFDAAGNLSGFLHDRIETYEAIQELHRTSVGVRLYCADPIELSVHANLPRLQILPFTAIPDQPLVDGEEAVLWWEGDATALDATMFAYPWRTVIAPGGDAKLRATLEKYGYRSDGASRVFHLAAPCDVLARACELQNVEYLKKAYAYAAATVQTANECLYLADLAETLGDTISYRANLERAAALDRNNATALLTLAACYLDAGESAAALIMLQEAARVSKLPEQVEELRQNLSQQLVGDGGVKAYSDLIDRAELHKPSERRRRVLLVTNLFPPQELGGYGRKMWEFAHGLRLRGHDVRVLAGDLPSLAKPPTPDEAALEPSVSRTLQLWGTWTKGAARPLDDRAEIARRMELNQKLTQEAIDSFKPDVVFAGNMDFLGVGPLNVALAANLPVLQALGNRAPGYDVSEQPLSSRYWIGSCSHWNASVVQSSGYAPGRVDVIYPGARVDRFFRFFVPDSAKLRICYASLVMPFKGVQTLVDALTQLHQRGIDFVAEIAGETTDASFLEELKRTAKNHGFDQKLKFVGFLDREGLSAMFARSNVLVFPSIVEEGFGISQVEAMAAGLVVISSGTGGAAEIIRHDVDGLLFPAGDPVALAERLVSLHGDKELFARVQRAGQQRAMEFSVDRSVFKIERLFDELIG
ncbi:glycosyltransferase [Opitutaceae bacterium EW11]|nr:glycosyltransferase [Opitutaceae bacterium EW11]